MFKDRHLSVETTLQLSLGIFDFARTYIVADLSPLLTIVPGSWIVKQTLGGLAFLQSSEMPQPCTDVHLLVAT